jgi:hypothetical protein
MAPAAEGDGVVAAVRRRAEALASMRPSAAAAAAAASLGHGPRDCPRLARTWSGARQTSWAEAGWSAPPASPSLGRGRVLARRSSAWWPPAHA